jgi:hypothetical protein
VLEAERCHTVYSTHWRENEVLGLIARPQVLAADTKCNAVFERVRV